ncbi:hypothetical protein GQ600_8935 [Phytophthora cactorum]|nr:hypothetical protein GQ600_8935 [Phytophthora cactorum]
MASLQATKGEVLLKPMNAKIIPSRTLLTSHSVAPAETQHLVVAHPACWWSVMSLTWISSYMSIKIFTW